MKRAGLQRSKAFWLSLLLVISQIVFIPLQSASANIVQSPCVIGSSSSCPAQSPQEIANLYGTTANGTYWLNVNGTATQTYLILDTNYPDAGGWFLGMKGTKTSTNFNYSSTNWTSQSTTLNTGSLSDDVSTDAKFDAYNHLPVTKVVGVFKDRNSYGFNANGSGVYGTNSFGGHTWKEDISSQSMFTRFTTTGILYSQTSTMTRYDLYRETNASNGKLVFAYQTGYAKYGFAYTFGSATYRWGIAFNNENDDPRIDSSDAQAGIGLTSYGAASVFSYTDNLGYSINGGTGQLNGSTATYSSGFQIWGKMASPSIAAPATLTRTNLGNGSIRLNIGSVAAATEYAVQYKTPAQQWSAATTVRLTSPSASTPSATLTGLGTGTYDFRVWSRATNNSSNTSISLLNQTIDSTSPTISSITFTSSPGADSIYGAGEILTATLGFSETVTVTGSPRIPIQGLTSKFLTYASGGGTPTLTFTYVVSAGDVDRNGISIFADSLSLNSGSITDSTLNSATLTHAAISNSLSLQVDGSVPIAGTPQTSSNGSSITITYDETLSATAPTAGSFSVSVNGVSNSVSSVSISGQSVQLTLSFSVISTASVTLAYVDPTAGNDVNAIQDEAGNDAASISTTSVTNLSTSSSNTSASISLNPAAMTAVFRTVTTIRVSANTAGRVDFYQSGKIIPGCRNVATSANVASCSWRPMVQSYVSLTARFRPSGSGFTSTNTAPLTIYVTKRTGLR